MFLPFFYFLQRDSSTLSGNGLSREMPLYTCKLVSFSALSYFVCIEVSNTKRKTEGLERSKRITRCSVRCTSREIIFLQEVRVPCTPYFQLQPSSSTLFDIRDKQAWIKANIKDWKEERGKERLFILQKKNTRYFYLYHHRCRHLHYYYYFHCNNLL